MDDDLGTPGALAVLFNEVREGNSAITAGDTEKVSAAFSSVTAMLDVFGLDTHDKQWADAAPPADLSPGSWTAGGCPARPAHAGSRAQGLGGGRHDP